MALRSAFVLTQCALALLALPAAGQTRLPDAPVQAPTGFKRPIVAPAIAITAPNGTPLRLEDFRGRVVLLNFWATWCPPCIREMPSLERLYQSLRQRGFVVLAVSVDREGADVVNPFVQRLGLTFPIALDPRGEASATYGAADLPSSFLIDRQGRVLAAVKGGRDWFSSAARAYVEGLLEAGGE